MVLTSTLPSLAIRQITKDSAPGWRIATLRAARDIMEMPRGFLGSWGGSRVGRQWAWQKPEEKLTEFIVQLIEGLWRLSQGFPTIKFHPVSLVTRKVRSSRC